MGLTRTQALLLASAAMIGVTAVAPQSAPLFRTQLKTVVEAWAPINDYGSLGQPHWVLESRNLAFQSVDTPRGADTRDLSALAKWADRVRSKEAYAALVRYSAAWLDVAPPDPPLTDKSDIWLRNKLEWLEYGAERGALEDPQNGFFPMFRAIGLWLQGRREESRAFLAKAASLPNFDDYAQYEPKRLAAVAASRLGPLTAEEMSIVYASIPLPHLSVFRSFGKQLAQFGDDNDRANVVRLAKTICAKGDYIIQVLVAKGFVVWALGEPKSVMADRDTEVLSHERRNRVVQLALRTSQPGLVRDWDFIDRVTDRTAIGGRLTDGYIDPWDASMDEMALARFIGAALLIALATLATALTCSLLMPASRTSAEPAGAVPHLLAAASWLVLGALVSTGDGALNLLSGFTALHLALAFQYNGILLAKAAGVTWGVLLLLYFLVESQQAWRTPLLWGSILVVPLSLQPLTVRAKWASISGMAVTLVSFAVSALVPQAMIPGVAFLAAWFIHKKQLHARPYASSFIILGTVLGTGYWSITEMSDHLGRSLLVTSFLVIIAIFLGYAFQLSKHPKRLAWCFLALTALFVANMGRSVALNQRGFQVLDAVLNEADTLRAKANQPAQLN